MKKIILQISFSIIVLHQASSELMDYNFPGKNVFKKVAAGTSAILGKAESFLNFYHNNVNKKITSLFGFECPPTLREYFADDKEEEKKRNEDNILTKTQPVTILKRVLDSEQYNFTTLQLISFYGYPSEAHEVITEDGYILTLHRIPHGKNLVKAEKNKTVLLYHGLFGSSADWVLLGPEKSLSFILADVGYDVWMANVRGNKYSKAHIKRKTNSSKFWNFSWHDVGQRDLPAIFSYMLGRNKNREKIIYISHSMGTTILFALLSTKPEYNKILKSGYALAPIAFTSNVRTPLKNLANFHADEFLWQIFGTKEFSPPQHLINLLSKDLCGATHYDAICDHVTFPFFGYDSKQVSPLIMPMIMTHIPAGTSTKTVIHYLQQIRNGGVFQQFDYGPKRNLINYGTRKPPKYSVNNITLPITLFSGENDWLASVSDVDNLFDQLANTVEHYVVPYKGFSHLDFMFAKNAPRLVYKKLLNLLTKDM